MRIAAHLGAKHAVTQLVHQSSDYYVTDVGLKKSWIKHSN